MNKQELSSYAMKRNLNLGQAEKDYFQNIILFIIYSQTGKELVFKGGTALAKCLGLNRFSEDLDFTLTNDVDVEGVISSGLDKFGIEYKIKKGKFGALMFKIEGPLYSGSEKTLCSITVDVSEREKVLYSPKIVTIGRHMDVIPAFDVYVMDEKEIMAEKVRAVLTRNSARDLFDIAFLLSNQAPIELETIDEKLAFYKIRFNYGSFVRKCESLRKVWRPELQSLVKNVPDFDVSLKSVKRAFSNIKRT